MIENIRKWILRIGIWVLIGGVVLGAILILFGDEYSGEVIGKFMGTMFIVALMMMICVNNFHRLVSDNRTVSIFALVGLISNVVWAALWILICWNPDWWYAMNPMARMSLYYSTGISALAKTAIVFSYLSGLGFVGSNILSIYEGDKRSIIAPLKITATACATYEMVYFIIITLNDFNISDTGARFGMLAGFAGFVWVIILIATLIISKREKNKRLNEERLEREKKAEKYDEVVAKSVRQESAQMGQTKTEDELRAEIEEKVRREMIEKEVREKVEREMAERRGQNDSGE